jgi:hypothetical protein
MCSFDVSNDHPGSAMLVARLHVDLCRLAGSM